MQPQVVLGVGLSSDLRDPDWEGTRVLNVGKESGERCPGTEIPQLLTQDGHGLGQWP